MPLRNRFKVENLEVRLINDDNIIATILDPSDISMYKVEII